VALPTDLPSSERFDVRGYARTASGSLREGSDLEAIGHSPIERETSEALAALRLLERSTMRRLRSLLVTPTHKDARVTAFLVTWSYEKFWIADALAAVLGPPPKPRRASPPARIAERLRPIALAVSTNLIGPSITGAHLATAYADTLLLESLYTRLAGSTDNAELARLLERIAEITGRHREFFGSDARRVLAASPSARRLARRSLRTARLPLGSDRIPAAQLRTLLAPARRGARELDSAVSALPGLRGLVPIDRATRR
jgi:hypothetical protein